MEYLFADLYLDENIPPIFANFIKDKGFNAVSAHELGNTGLSDMQQLSIAIKLDRVLITGDKKNFLKISKATSQEHAGIILITRQYKTVASLNELLERAASVP